jgi:hypothetical protein
VWQAELDRAHYDLFGAKVADGGGGGGQERGGCFPHQTENNSDFQPRGRCQPHHAQDVPPLLHLLHLSTPPLLTTACRRSLLSLEHALAVAGFMVCRRTLPPNTSPPTSSSRCNRRFSCARAPTSSVNASDASGCSKATPRALREARRALLKAKKQKEKQTQRGPRQTTCTTSIHCMQQAAYNAIS